MSWCAPQISVRWGAGQYLANVWKLGSAGPGRKPPSQVEAGQAKASGKRELRREDRIFGYDGGELLGQHVSVQTRYPPEENRRILAEIFKEVELSGRRLPLCIREDVTESRRLQEQLQIERRLDATGRLAGGIAHDLNNRHRRLCPVTISDTVVAKQADTNPPQSP